MAFFVLVCAAFGVSCSPSSDVSSSKKLTLGLFVGHGYSDDAQKEMSAALLAVRQINDAGGISLKGEDYTFEVHVEDHGGKPSVAVAALKSFEEGGATVVIGPPWSSLALGEKPDHSDGVSLNARKHNLLLISPSATAPDLTELRDDDLQWRTAPSDAIQAKVAADALLRAGKRSAAMLHRADPWGDGFAKVFRAAFEKGGGKVVATVDYSTDLELNTYDFDTELNAVFLDTPDAIVLATFSEVFQITNRIESRDDLSSYVAPPLFFGTDANFNADLLVNASPAILGNMWGTSPYPDLENPDYENFLTWSAKAGVDTSDNTSAPRYDAVFLAALAIQMANSTDADAIKKELRAASLAEAGDVTIHAGDWKKAKEAILSGKGINYEGVSGSIEFSPEGDPTVGTYVVWKVKNASGGYEFDLTETVSFKDLP